MKTPTRNSEQTVNSYEVNKICPDRRESTDTIVVASKKMGKCVLSNLRSTLVRLASVKLDATTPQLSLQLHS